MQRNIFSILILLLWIGLYSCSENSGGSETEELEVSEEVQEQAAFGYQVNEIVGTGDEVSSLTNPQDVDDGDIDIPLETARALSEKANSLTKEAQSRMIDLPRLFKASGEILLFEERDTVGTKIIWAAMYYDADLGLVRYQVVTSNTNPDRRIQHDSSSIRIEINDINTASDDRLLSLYNYRRFASRFIVQAITDELIASAWDTEGEVTGFTASSTSTYHEDRNLQKIISTIVLNPDESGTITQTFYFDDGETRSHSVTFNGDGTGSFERNFRK